MKKTVFIIAICVLSLGFISCGSTAPCGLSQKTEKQKQNKYEQKKVLVAETITTNTNN